MHPEDYLRLIRKLDTLIKQKEYEKIELFTLATKVTQENDDMPHAPGVSDKVGNLSVKLTMKEQEIDHIIDIYVDLRDEIIEQINKLPIEESDVLHKFYVQKMKLQQIADEVDMSIDWVKKWKNRGISMITVKESDVFKEACRLLKM